MATSPEVRAHFVAQGNEVLGRGDYALISSLIPAGARVLDLGCGDGALLAWLKENRRIEGRGIEIRPELAQRAASRGVPGRLLFGLVRDVLQSADRIDAGSRLLAGALPARLPARIRQWFTSTVELSAPVADPASMLWAVHPGGRLILDAVQDACGLADEQMHIRRGQRQGSKLFEEPARQ